MATPPRPHPRKPRTTADATGRPDTSPQYCPPSLSSSFSQAPPESLGFGSPLGTLPNISSQPSTQQPFTSSRNVVPHHDTAELETLHLEIEQQKEKKDRLVSEVSSLHSQKENLQEEKQMLQKEIEALNHQVTSMKQKIAQYEQNMEVFQTLSQHQHRSKGQADIEEREYLVKEKEMAMEQREMELRSQGDALFQREKELNLREFDIANGPEQQQQQQQQKQSDHATALQAHESDLKMRESRLQMEQDRLKNWAAELEEADRRTKENHLRAKEAMDEARRMRRESLDLAAAISVELDQRKDGNDTLNSSGSSASPATVPTGPGATNAQSWGREPGATPQQWAGGGQTGWQHTTGISGGPPPATGYQHHGGGPPPATGYQHHGGGPPPATGYQHHGGGPPPATGYQHHGGGSPATGYQHHGGGSSATGYQHHGGVSSATGYQTNSGNRIAQSASSPQLKRSVAPSSQPTQSTNLIHDAQVARQLHLELKGERYREDEELARKLAAEFNLDHKMQRSTDEELALQLTREELGTDVIDPEALQKLATEEYERKRKAQETAKRDAELARLMADQQNED